MLHSLEGKQRRLNGGKLAAAGQSGGLDACVNIFSDIGSRFIESCDSLAGVAAAEISQRSYQMGGPP